MKKANVIKLVLVVFLVFVALLGSPAIAELGSSHQENDGGAQEYSVMDFVPAVSADEPCADETKVGC